MAQVTGNGGDVQIGSSTVAEMLDWSLTESVEILDTGSVGDSSDTHTTGTTNWSGSVSCFWDKSDSSGQESMTIGASVVVHLRPEGAGTGDVDFTGTVTITSIERSLSRNSIVTANFSFQGNGDLTRTVLS